MRKSNITDNQAHHWFSRRFFLKAVAAGSAGLLAGCQSAAPTPGSPASSQIGATRPEVMRFWPDRDSTVARVRDRGVWNNGRLVSARLRTMLDNGISALTGLDDARLAWSALFAPHERIAIKINTIRDSAVWTHIRLVFALTGCLTDAGVAPEQIIVFDRGSDEMIRAGYPFNRDGPGVRFSGTDDRYTAGWDVLGKPVDLSNIVLACDALINVPLLKPHGSSGITFALKNHYGSFAYPWRPSEWWHETEGITQGLPTLNNLPALKDRTRLVIGDVLQTVSADWHTATENDTLLMSFDPVAHDATGLSMAVEAARAAGEIDPGTIQAGADLASRWLANAADLGLGTNDPAHIQLVELGQS